MSAHRDDIDAARLMDPGACPPHAYQSRVRTRGPPLLLTPALLPLPPNPLQVYFLWSHELQQEAVLGYEWCAIFRQHVLQQPRQHRMCVISTFATRPLTPPKHMRDHTTCSHTDLVIITSNGSNGAVALVSVPSTAPRRTQGPRRAPAGPNTHGHPLTHTSGRGPRTQATRAPPRTPARGRPSAATSRTRRAPASATAALARGLCRWAL